MSLFERGCLISGGRWCCRFVITLLCFSVPQSRELKHQLGANPPFQMAKMLRPTGEGPVFLQAPRMR